MLVTIGIIYLNKFFLPVQLKGIVAQKAQEFFKREVSFDAITFSPLKGIVLTNVNVAQKDAPDKPFIHINELSLTIVYHPLIFEKKIIIPSVTLNHPSLYLTRISANEWNFSDLLQKQTPSSTPPSKTPGAPSNFLLGGITINDGEVNLLDKTTQPAYAETLENLDVKINLSLQKGIKFNLDGVLPKNDSQISLEGDSDLSLQLINANLELSNITLSEYLSLYLKNDQFHLASGFLKEAHLTFNRTGEKFSIQGDCEIKDADLKVGADQEFRGQLKLPNLAVVIVPQKETDVAASFTLQNADITLNPTTKIQGNLKADNINGSLTDNHTLQAQGALMLTNAAISLPEQRTLTSSQMTLTDGAFKFIDGKMGGSANLKIADFLVTLDKTQKIQTQFTASPFILEFADNTIGIKGNLSLDGTQAALNGIQSLTGDIDANNTELTIKGKAIHLTSAIQIKKADIKPSASEHLQGNITASNTALDINDKIIHVKSDLRIDEANLAMADKTVVGNPQASLDLTYNPASSPALSYEGTLFPNVALISSLPVVQEIKDIKGKINFKTDSLGLEDVSLTTQDIPLKVAGAVNNFQSPVLDIQASTDSFKLEQALKLIPKDMLSKIRITPSGDVKLNVQFKGSPAAFDKADVQAVAQLSNASLQGEALPVAITNIAGEIRYTPQAISWKDLKGVFQKDDFVLNGQLKNLNAPQINTTIVSESRKANLTAQGSFQTPVLKIDSLKGTYSQSTFDLAGDVTIKDNTSPQMDVSGKLAFNLKDLAVIDPALKEQLDALKINGIVNWQGRLKGSPTDFRHLETKSTATIPELALYGYHLNDINLNLELADQKIKQCHLTAGVYEGQLKLDGTMDLSKQTFPYHVDADLSKTNLAKVKSDTIWKDKDVSGFLSASAHLDGPLTQWMKMEGTGTVLMNDGKLWELNLLQGLGKFIFTSDFENILINEISADLIFRAGQAWTDNLMIKSDPMNISGHGAVGFEGNLDFTFNAQFNDQAKVEGSELAYKTMMTRVAGIMGSIFDFKLSGTVKNPQFTKVISPKKTIEKGLELFLQGVSEGAKDILK